MRKQLSNGDSEDTYGRITYCKSINSFSFANVNPKIKATLFADFIFF